MKWYVFDVYSEGYAELDTEEEVIAFVAKEIKLGDSISDIHIIRGTEYRYNPPENAGTLSIVEGKS